MTHTSEWWPVSVNTKVTKAIWELLGDQAGEHELLVSVSWRGSLPLGSITQTSSPPLTKVPSTGNGQWAMRDPSGDHTGKC